MGEGAAGEDANGGNAAEDKPREEWNPFKGKPGMEEKVMQDAVAYINQMVKPVEL